MKLKERMLHRIRVMGLEDTTFKTYWFWCQKYIRFCRKPDGTWVDPDDCGKPEVERWLSSMVNGREWVSKRTQNLALQSVCYLYKQVLNKPLEGVNALRAKAPETVREVVDESELMALFRELRGVGLLASMMMYGCGWVYEPDWLRVGNWTPDFYCWSSQWMPALYLSIEIIEYKPSMPTDTYIEEMASNVGLMQRRHGEAIQLYYGSPFNTDRGVYHFLDYEGSIRVNHSPCDWLGGLSDVIASFRYDLEAN